MRALLCVIMLLLGTVNNGMAETMVFSSIGGFTLVLREWNGTDAGD